MSLDSIKQRFYVHRGGGHIIIFWTAILRWRVTLFTNHLHRYLHLSCKGLSRAVFIKLIKKIKLKIKQKPRLQPPNPNFPTTHVGCDSSPHAKLHFFLSISLFISSRRTCIAFFSLFSDLGVHTVLDIGRFKFTYIDWLDIFIASQIPITWQ